jgi:hypothetical protein
MAQLLVSSLAAAASMMVLHQWRRTASLVLQWWQPRVLQRR